MTKPRQSNAKARHQWKQIPFCACGRTAVKLLPGHEGICQRCDDIEQGQKDPAVRSHKLKAVQKPFVPRLQPLDLYEHPMPTFR